MGLQKASCHKSMLFTPDTTPDANILLSIAGLSKIGGAVAAWQATETSMLQLAPVSFCTCASDIIGCAEAVLACMLEDVHELKGRCARAGLDTGKVAWFKEDRCACAGTAHTQQRLHGLKSKRVC